MRYIGSKNNVLPFIDDVIEQTFGDVRGCVFADLFSGTAIVGRHYKEKGARIISGDYMMFSYCLQMERIGLNRAPTSSKSYYQLVENLNELQGIRGFFFQNYTLEGSRGSEYERNYFSSENAVKIDAIREKIVELYDAGKISIEMKQLLKANLIDAVTNVSNTAGTYGAFQKKPDPRMYKTLKLQPSSFIDNGVENICMCAMIEDTIGLVSGDILYLDPPYNSRQYPPYYHILETIAMEDYPAIYGLTGRRPYKDKMSAFCKKAEALQALLEVIRKAKFNNVYLSYNSDGIVNIEELMAALSTNYSVELFTRPYRRYKSSSSEGPSKLLKEIVLYAKK